MKRNRQLTATELAVSVPPFLIKERFQAGFAHAMRGGQLDKVEYFKLSFRIGYRAAKLQMRDLRRKQGIIDFPLRAKIKIKSL